jgi:type IV secretion system protein TrbI
MENEDMRPKKSPKGIRRVNEWPRYIFLLTLFGVALIGVLFAFYEPEPSVDDDQKKKTRSQTPEEMAASIMAGRRISPNPPKTDQTAPPKENVPKAPPPPTPEEQNIDRIAQLKLQEFEAAVNADMAVTGFENKAKDVKQVKAVDAQQPDRWTLNSKVEAPESDYTVRAGAVIPGVMISGVNSELPGHLIAQVSQDVYDTAEGPHKLIPQGTKLFGTYDSQVVYGQEAVLVAWQRLTFPDGKVLDIGEMPGADSAGYSGFRDSVDHHYIRTYGSALLMSAIVGGVALSQGNSGGGLGFQQNSNQVLSQVLGQQLGSVTSQMLSKNLNIAPTIMIRPGYSFNIVVTKDLILPSDYRNFDYK